MANMIQSAKERINEILQAAYEKAAEKGQLPAGAVLSGTVEIPKDTANGDFAANHAMTGARAMRMAPRKIAEALAENAQVFPPSFVTAGPQAATGAGRPENENFSVRPSAPRTRKAQ